MKKKKSTRGRQVKVTGKMEMKGEERRGKKEREGKGLERKEERNSR